jgi:hypothetical protein
MSPDNRDTVTVQVVLELSRAEVALVDAMAQHTGDAREQVVADGLRLLFVALPREGE